MKSIEVEIDNVKVKGTVTYRSLKDISVRIDLEISNENNQVIDYLREQDKLII